MEKHLNLLAAFHIAFAALGLLAAAVVFVALSGSGILSGDMDAAVWTTLLGLAIASFLVIVSIPGLIGALGVLKRKGWARILLMIVGAINLLNFPFGTMLGIYTLWVLIHEDTARLFRAPAA